MYLAVDELVDGGDELPAVAEDEEPHDRQGDAGQPEMKSTRGRIEQKSPIREHPFITFAKFSEF